MLKSYSGGGQWDHYTSSPVNDDIYFMGHTFDITNPYYYSTLRVGCVNKQIYAVGLTNSGVSEIHNQEFITVDSHRFEYYATTILNGI